MTTETEAREKWCPFARACGTVDASSGDGAELAVTGNRFGDPWRSAPQSFREATLCSASECMAWRWRDPELESVEYFSMGRQPEGLGWTCTLSDKGREKMQVKSRWERPTVNRCGYCGLAGKP